MIRDYPESSVEWPPSRRVGGYYQSLEEIKHAAELLDFDVVVPPMDQRNGWYMCPAPSDETQAAHALAEAGRPLASDKATESAHKLLRG